MPSDLRTCPECGAALDCVSAQMDHWDWHRQQRAHLTELGRRLEVLERDTRREGLERE